MFRLGVSEYIRNTWYNIVVILIMVAMMCMTVIFVSNVDRQTRLYRLTSEYIDGNSIFLNYSTEEDWNVLNKVEKIMSSQTTTAWINNIDNSRFKLLVYSDDFMKFLSPRLDEGQFPYKKKLDEDVIPVVISHNHFGISKGDIISIKVFTNSEDAININVYIAGILSDGQSVASLSGNVLEDMNYEDFFEIYNYEQTGEVIMITTKEELYKISNNIMLFNYNSIVKFEENITQEEREANINAVKQYERERFKVSSVDAYPETDTIIKWNKEIFNSILIKNIPLTVAIFILVLTCIAGIVSIKTYRSARYFGILYICGMHYKKAAVITGVEMLTNCGIALMLTMSILKIQSKLKIFGTINCDINIITVLILIVIISITVVFSMVMARRCLKENTAVEILRNI